MRYTFKDFKAEYPDDKACLLSVLENRYGDTCPRCGVMGVKFHPITGRKGFVCSECDKHIYPLADTIFRKSETSLWNWFYAIYLFSVSNNGVSAPELQKHLGVTYKTAWRMCKLIRQLMEDDTPKLDGSVEIDELQYGHKGPHKNTRAFMAVQRGGKAKFQVTDWASTNRAMSFVRANMETGVDLYSDGSTIYQWADKEYKHSSVVHSRKEYVRGKTHVNTVEGLWGYIESAIDGTYRGVSPKYFQLYLNEFVYRYNHKGEAICQNLLAKV